MDNYQKYEAAKALLKAQNLPPEAYEKALKMIAKRLRI